MSWDVQDALFIHIISSWLDLGLFQSQKPKKVGLKESIGHGQPSPVVKSFILFLQ